MDNASLEMKIHNVKDRLGNIEHKVDKLEAELVLLQESFARMDVMIDQLKDKIDDL